MEGIASERGRGEDLQISVVGARRLATARRAEKARGLRSSRKLKIENTSSHKRYAINFDGAESAAKILGPSRAPYSSYYV